MMATALENNGAKVYILGRRLEVLENAAKLYAKHSNIHPLKCDVTSKADLIQATKTIEEADGKVDLLVVNSGIMSQALNDFTPEIKADPKKLSEFWMNKSEQSWADTFSVNVTAVFFTTVAFLGLLDASNQARKTSSDPKRPTAQVVITSSIAGFLRVAPFAMTYSASKAATTHLAKVLATFFVDYDIRVNVITPGIYPSSMTGTMDSSSNKTDLEPFPASVIPLRRSGAEEEMGGAILYLASRAGGYSNGAVLVTDGGRLSILPSTY